MILGPGYSFAMAIQRLPSDVVNQIAAGEVVERPSHLVKELIENSLDAGATMVEVEFEKGGRKVRITDNGRGIAADELPLALARHATSKIAKADDIFDLHTFGFRGEALASIAAVSRLQLVSREPSAATAHVLRAEFGAIDDVKPLGGNVGTSIAIDDLFENVPARLKFLKSEAAESTQIKAVVRALALINPSVEFRLKSAGKVLQVYSRAESFLERAAQVIDLPRLYENKMSFNGFDAHVVFASPHDVSGQARSMFFFVQDRWVQDRGLQAAVVEAYRGLLMHGEYPIAAIRLLVPRDEIDVNIHPTKSQVKFRDQQTAFRAVNRCLREGLERAPWLPPTAAGSAREIAPNFSPESSTRPAYTASSFIKAPQASYDVSPPMSALGSDSALMRTQYAQRNDAALPLETRASFVESSAVPIVASTETGRGYWSSLQVIGQAHLTYIIAQAGDKLVLVDQHAAHERVAFERLMRGWKNGEIEVQNYLLPVTIELSEDGIDAVLTVLPDLEKMKFSVDRLGPTTLAVRAAPVLLTDKALAASFEKLAFEMTERGGSFAIEKYVSDLFATMACHSVVRAGQPISTQQIQSLLVQMDEFPLSSFCPHGRPVSVDYPFAQLERDFGRIV